MAPSLTPEDRGCLTGAIHCPSCGYDQTGLPLDHLCPECGTAFAAADVLHRIQRLVDRGILDLWSIAIMLGVGCVCTALSATGLRHYRPAGMVLLTASTLYVAVGVPWFLLVAGRILRYRFRPIFLNVTTEKRGALNRWLLIDAAICTSTAVLYAHLTSLIN